MRSWDLSFSADAHAFTRVYCCLNLNSNFNSAFICAEIDLYVNNLLLTHIDVRNIVFCCYSLIVT